MLPSTFSKFHRCCSPLGFTLPLIFFPFNHDSRRTMTEFASCCVSTGLISSKTNLWEKMLAWGRKMLNEIHHRKLQFWYYSQQVIFYINFKQISTTCGVISLFFFVLFSLVWSLSLQRNKVREKVLQFSDLMLLECFINWDGCRQFLIALIALKVLFMSIHGDHACDFFFFVTCSCLDI